MTASCVICGKEILGVRREAVEEFVCASCADREEYLAVHPNDELARMEAEQEAEEIGKEELVRLENSMR